MYTPGAAVGIPRRAEDGLTPTHTVGPRALGYLRLGHLCHWPSAPLASTRLVIDALGIHNLGHNMPLAICALDTHNSGSHAIGHLCAWYPRRLPYAPLPPPFSLSLPAAAICRVLCMRGMPLAATENEKM